MTTQESLPKPRRKLLRAAVALSALLSSCGVPLDGKQAGPTEANVLMAEAEPIPAISSSAQATEKAVRIAPPRAVRAPRLVHIGDSKGDAKMKAGFAALLQAGGIELTGHDEKGARPLIWFPCDRDASSLWCEGPAYNGALMIGAGDGVRSALRLRNEIALADVVIVDLGQNTFTSTLYADEVRVLDTIWELAMADGKPAAILFETMDHSNTTYVQGSAPARNAIYDTVITDETAAGKDVRLINTIDQHFPLADGIHYTPAGARMEAEFEAAIVIPIANEMLAKNG